MNKNKKRLSKLLIPMLALTAMNVNAMENVEKKDRSKSFTKKRSAEKLNSLKKMEPGGVVLLKNKLLNKGKQNKCKKNIILSSGDAYLGVREQYELVDLNKGRHNYDVETGIKTKGASGCEGTVTQWRNRATGELCAIKLVSTSILKNHEQRGWINFYDAYKYGQMGFDKTSWAVRQIDQISDDNVTYTIQEWIDGKTLKEWYKDLRKEPSLAIKIQKIADVMRQINNFITDITKNNLLDLDLHDENIMITPDGIMKNIDFSCKKNTNNKDIEKRNKSALGRNLKGAMESIEIGNLKTANKDSDKYKVYKTMERLLREYLNYNIIQDKTVWTLESKNDKFVYTSKNRENFISGLEELAKSLKK